MQILIKYSILLLGMVSMGLSQPDIEHENNILLRTLKRGFDIKKPEFEEIKVSEKVMNDYQINGKVFRVSNPNKSQVVIIYSGRVYSCRSGGCSTPHKTSGKVSGEYFDYFAIFDTKGNIKEVRVHNYKATKGHGIVSKGWLRQFEKLNHNEKPVVGKNIDGISGATISSHAITEDMALRIKMMGKILKRKPKITGK